MQKIYSNPVFDEMFCQKYAIAIYFFFWHIHLA
jgi:hypothetical protein